MEKRVCCRCRELKSIDEFGKAKAHKIGIRYHCKKCDSVREKELRYSDIDKVREIGRINYQKNKKKISVQNKERRKKNIEKHRLRWREWDKKNNEWYVIKRKERYHNNIEKSRLVAAASQRKRRKENPLFKFKSDIRHRVYGFLKTKGLRKHEKSEILLGCTFELAKKHIERQFKKGMNWNNHGNGDGKWNIDHKIPLASAKTEEDIKSLCHYTNLQPLWYIENKIKRDKILPIQTTLIL